MSASPLCILGIVPCIKKRKLMHCSGWKEADLFKTIKHRTTPNQPAATESRSKISKVSASLKKVGWIRGGAANSHSLSPPAAAALALLFTAILPGEATRPTRAVCSLLLASITRGRDALMPFYFRRVRLPRVVDSIIKQRAREKERIG